ncbi:MAG: LamG domain-containing protein [Gammaproteobacteria bacterium]|nr:LamG domain-containing protein [Gammaproteobacteria bacterium]
MSADHTIRFGRLEPFTVELWVKPQGRPDGGLWSLGTRWYLHLGRFGQFGYRAASFPIRYSPLGTALDLPPDTWRHVALTHDANRRVVVYVNGEAVAEVVHADEGDYEKGGPQLHLGSHDGWTQCGAMTVDEVRLSRGVRVYAPLLAQRFLIPGESLQPRDAGRRAAVLRGQGPGPGDLRQS